MLKVLKYDWRNGWNSVKTTLLAALILSVIVGVSFGAIGGKPVVSERVFGIMGDGGLDKAVMLLSLVWTAVMFALLVLTVDTIVRNMSTRMFGPEGHLTHTLPVETWELLGGKAIGTWLFGVFMVGVAIASVLLMMVGTAAGAGSISKIITAAVEMLPKLGAYHFRQIASGVGYTLYGIGAFLVWSLLLVIQFQFVCIAARQFGRFHMAGGVIVFFLLFALEGNLNQLLSMGFVICLLSSAACFCGSLWLLKHRLSIG